MKGLATSMFLVASALLFMVPAAAATESAHLTWARIAVEELEPELNEYNSSPSYLEFDGENGATATLNRSVCSSFVNLLMMDSYDLTSSSLKSWVGSSSPNAAMWYDAIVAQKGFKRLAKLTDAQPGDIVAMKYPDGESTSGHIAVIAGKPVARSATSPVISGTSQYEVSVIDSSKSGHGSTDTRKMDDGTWDTGVGQGIMRIYTDAAGTIVGYSWSTYSNSTYYANSSRSIAVGRVTQY